MSGKLQEMLEAFRNDEQWNTPEGIAQVAYADHATADSSDITEGKLLEAFRKADTILRLMDKLAEEERHGG